MPRNKETIPHTLKPILDRLPTKDAMDEQFRTDIRQYIVEHIGDSEYSPDRLAKDMGISKNVLGAKMKAIYGAAPVEVITRIRIQAATELLTQTELAIFEIAYRTGFNDPKYFSRVYKKQTGVSPTEARQKAVRLN